MSDIDIIIHKIKKRKPPVALPKAIQNDVYIWDEYKHFPYSKLYIRYPGYPKEKNPEPSHDYSQDYLTFEILTGGNISWSYYDSRESNYTDATKPIYYSKNNGEWTLMPRTLSVDTGDVIRFKGDNSTYGDGEYNYNTFAEESTATFNVNGNIMSLISSSNFTNLTALTVVYTFYWFMAGCKIIDASNLVLPATTLTSNCYSYMFYNCTSLIYGPEVLPATGTASSNIYANMFSGCSSLQKSPKIMLETAQPGNKSSNAPLRSMFYNCSSLTEIYCMLTTSPSAVLSNNFSYGVAQNGTFYKNINATWDITGTYAVPEGWAVVLVDPQEENNND